MQILRETDFLDPPLLPARVIENRLPQFPAKRPFRAVARCGSAD